MPVRHWTEGLVDRGEVGTTGSLSLFKVLLGVARVARCRGVDHLGLGSLALLFHVDGFDLGPLDLLFRH